MSELFPLRVVTGKRFCNRESEKIFLKQCISQKSPVVLISPRRYGKTSLANKVVEELGYPFCSIDFLTAYDDDSICLHIIQGISELVSHIMPANLKALQLIEKCFYGVKVAIRYKNIELEYASPINIMDPTRQVLDALKGLDILATKLKKTVVIFMDEFQGLMETPKGQAIQGAIRHVAQASKHVSFLFSGSSRHMLLKVFDDSNLPMYMMCEKLLLERIDSAHYIPYIQTAANIQWKKHLPDSVTQRILYLTENHSFYVNYLCSQLWKNKTPPQDEAIVDEIWHQCFLSEERRLIADLDKLTQTQRLVLKGIAQAVDLHEPTGMQFLTKIKLSSGTVVPVLKALTQKDMIFVDKQGVMRVLDPLLKYMLLNK